MASRLARSAMGAARLRPTVSATRALPATTTSFATSVARQQPDQPKTAVEEPAKRAKSILDSLPGSNLVSKTAILSAGAGLSIAAISNELYVVNEESIILLSLFTIYWAVAHYGGPLYKDWVESTGNRINGILNAARKDHTEAVQSRIENVKDLGSVTEITKNLFEVSKETARLEAEAYEMEQKTALAAEARNVLDSWVRYEGQVKQRQQRELADSIVGKIEKELEDPKVLQRILNQSVQDVERIVSAKS